MLYFWRRAYFDQGDCRLNQEVPDHLLLKSFFNIICLHSSCLIDKYWEQHVFLSFLFKENHPFQWEFESKCCPLHMKDCPGACCNNHVSGFRCEFILWWAASCFSGKSVRWSAVAPCKAWVAQHSLQPHCRSKYLSGSGTSWAQPLGCSPGKCNFSANKIILILNCPL